MLSPRAISLAVLVFAAFAFAQTMGTGTITGTVTDPTGAVVPGVKITAINLATGIERSVVTNPSGSYLIPALQIGQYQVKAAHPGFKTVTHQDVGLDVDTSVAVNFALEVGSAEQSVTV